MSKNGQYILRFDLRYALFLWEDDPEVKRLIEKLKLKRDEEQISLMRKISPNKTDVLEDINYYLLYNEFHRSKGNDISNIPMEMIFVALINGDKQIHGYIMANNFITGTPLMVDEDTLRETSEVILDTYKIYKSMEEEKERATRAEHELMIKNMELQEIAIKDALTGLFTKRYFQEVFPLELERAKREETNVGITFFDIDHFKDVNDEYGHEVGDMVLANVAAIIKEECRKSDIPCRFGGEEIVIISNDIENVLQVIALAKRIREKINNFVFEIQKHGQLPIKFQITVSIGIAIGSAKVILTDADDAMYYSKKHGRNKVVVKDPEKAKMQPLMLPILSEDHEFIVFIE